MRRPIQIALISSTVTLWIALVLLIIRQRHLLDSADPMSNTGLSFGYTFLTRFAPLAMLVVTAIAVSILGVMEHRWKKRLKGSNQAASES